MPDTQTLLLALLVLGALVLIAVIVLALREDRGRPEVLVIRQYRHALGVTEWELPAGLLDVDGEAPVDAAARELAEEVDLRAGRWDLLSGYSSSPGALDETVRVFLARDLTEVAAVVLETDGTLSVLPEVPDLARRRPGAR